MDMRIRATNDLFVKYLFAKEQNKPVLIDFINAVLADSGFETIDSVSLKNPFNQQTFLSAKTTVVDVKAVSQNGNIYNIEVQAYRDKGFLSRSLYYWSALYYDQIDRGDWYGILRPVICINLVDYILFPEEKRYHTCFQAREMESHALLYDYFQMHFCEIPKIRHEKIAERLKEWLYFFDNEGMSSGDEDLEMDRLRKEDKVLSQVHDEYKRFTANEEYKEIIWMQDKARLDRNSSIEYARLDGIEEGKEEGLKLGIEQGIEQGLATGQRKALLETAQKMKDKGIPVETIIEITGLPREEIASL